MAEFIVGSRCSDRPPCVGGCPPRIFTPCLIKAGGPSVMTPEGGMLKKNNNDNLVNHFKF